jgi:hypothetical protein
MRVLREPRRTGAIGEIDGAKSKHCHGYRLTELAN